MTDKVEKRSIILLTKHEIQSGTDRKDWAEGLIQQLPSAHDGRNSWLLNYGVRKEAQNLRKKQGLKFQLKLRAAESGNQQVDEKGKGEHVKPPLGVIPRDVWEVRQGMERVYDLIEGIKEYESMSMPIPRGWCDELSELVEKYLPKLVSDKVETPLTRSMKADHPASRRFEGIFAKIAKGQECECPDGLGRVIDWRDDFPHEMIKVATYVKNRGCEWDPSNVTLIEPDYQGSITSPIKPTIKHSGWINVFHGIDNCIQTGIKIYNTADDAVLGVTKQGTLDKDYIVTIFIEWEE